MDGHSLRRLCLHWQAYRDHAPYHLQRLNRSAIIDQQSQGKARQSGPDREQASVSNLPTHHHGANSVSRQTQGTGTEVAGLL